MEWSIWRIALFWLFVTFTNFLHFRAIFSTVFVNASLCITKKIALWHFWATVRAGNEARWPYRCDVVQWEMPSSEHASVGSASYSGSFVRIWSEIKFKLSLGQSGASYIQKIINLSVSESVMHEKKIYFFGAFLTYFIGGKLNTVKDMRWLFSHSKKGLYIFRCCGPNPFVSGIICRFRILKK